MIPNYSFCFDLCIRQSNGSSASGSTRGEAFHFNLQCFTGSRWVSEVGALAGCPEPDPAELPAWPKGQREWATTRGACLFPKRHLRHNHPQGGLPRWRLLHLHLRHSPVWFKAGSHLPHCHLWVRDSGPTWQRETCSWCYSKHLHLCSSCLGGGSKDFQSYLHMSIICLWYWWTDGHEPGGSRHGSSLNFYHGCWMRDKKKSRSSDHRSSRSPRYQKSNADMIFVSHVAAFMA